MNAFTKGFIKRASEYGLNQQEATTILKKANIGAANGQGMPSIPPSVLPAPGQGVMPGAGGLIPPKGGIPLPQGPMKPGLQPQGVAPVQPPPIQPTPMGPPMQQGDLMDVLKKYQQMPMREDGIARMMRERQEKQMAERGGQPLQDGGIGELMKKYQAEGPDGPMHNPMGPGSNNPLFM